MVHLTELPSDPEERAAELKRRIEGMDKYRFSGFGDDAKQLRRYINGAIRRNPILSKDMDGLRDCYTLLEMRYNAIPFSELAPSQDFAPLYVTRDLLSSLGETVNKIDKEVFQGGREKHLSFASDLAAAVSAVSYLYGKKFYDYLRALRKMPGYEDYRSDLK